MFGIKSRKRIKELEAELAQATKIKNDLSNANDILKQGNSKLISDWQSCRIQCRDLEAEIESLKSKLTRKKPIKKSEQC